MAEEDRDVSYENYRAVQLGFLEKKRRTIKAPFKYAGNKHDILPWLLPQLPYRKSYIEVFGGTGVVLLNRVPQKMEVLNDRFSGIVDVYRSLKFHPEELMESLQNCPFAREDWEANIQQRECKTVWDRAAAWLTGIQFSHTGRSIAFAKMTHPVLNPRLTIENSIPLFKHIHTRLKNVTIENLDWRDMLDMYDDPQAVFYLDPPYITGFQYTYAYNMTEAGHREMLDRVFRLNGFVAVSSFPNAVYDSYPWTRVTRFERKSKINAAYTPATEALYIKEAK